MSTGNNPQQYPFAKPRTCGLAVASLVISCVGVLIWPLCVPGIICGHLARRQIRKNPGLGGDGLALAGLITGYFFFIFIAIFLMVAAPILLFLLKIGVPYVKEYFHRGVNDLEAPKELTSVASLFLAGWHQ